MNQTPLPKEELAVFNLLEGLEVIFDVGARIDVDYALMRPEAICHLFEPSPEFFTELEEKTRDIPNVRLNNFGMSDMMGEFYYDPNVQSFRNQNPIHKPLPVRTIEWYCKEKGIGSIDFLKTDTEGWDYKVIVGAKALWPHIKYIQYEHWNDDERYRALLGDLFECEYIGYRNGFCMNKVLVSQEERQRLIQFIRDNKMGELQ